MTTILYVEGHEGTAQLVKDLLEYVKGYEVLIAEDGVVGYEMALTHQPDLIITEMQLRRKDGYSLIRKLLQTPSFRQVPILIVTVIMGQGIDWDALRSNYFLNLPYVLKPIETRIFPDLIAWLLERAEAHAASDTASDDGGYPFFISAEEWQAARQLCEKRGREKKR